MRPPDLGDEPAEYKASASLLLVLPVVVSNIIFLISDIDNPRGGLIHVAPQNLVSLILSLPRQ
jgi:hypothetical protein